MPFDLATAKPASAPAAEVAAPPVAPPARKFNLATAKPAAPPATAPSEIPQENAQAPEQPGYLSRYFSGIGEANSRAKSEGLLDAVKDSTQALASVGTGILSPLGTIPRVLMNKLGLTDAPNETVAQSAERFIYRPSDPGAAGAADTVGAVLKPVGDLISLPGKAYAGLTDALGLSSGQDTKDIEDFTTQVTGAALGARSLSPKVAAVPKVPKAATAAETARAAGFKLAPSQAGGLLGKIGESAAGTAKVTDRLARSNAGRATELAKQELKVPAGKELTPETFTELRKPHNAAYADAGTKLGKLTADDALRAKFAAVGEGQGSAVTPNRGVLRLRDTFSRVKELDAKQVIQEVRSLREKASANQRVKFGDKNKVELNQLGKAQQQMADILDDWIVQQAERTGQPEIAAAYKNARVQLAKIGTVERATSGGKVSQQKLTAAAKKGAPLTGNLKIIADVGEKFPETTGKPRAQSAIETGVETAADVLTGGLRSAVARPLVSKLLESDLYQNRLGKVNPSTGPGGPLAQYFPDKRPDFPQKGDPAVGPRQEPPGDPAVGPAPPPYDRVEFTPTPDLPTARAPEFNRLVSNLAGDLELAPEVQGAPDNLARALPSRSPVGSGSEGTVRPGATDVAVGNERVAQVANPALAEELLAGLNRAPELPAGGPTAPRGLEVLPDALLSELGLAPDNYPAELAGDLQLAPEGPAAAAPAAAPATFEPGLMSELESLARQQVTSPDRVAAARTRVAVQGGRLTDEPPPVTPELAADLGIRFDPKTNRVELVTPEGDVAGFINLRTSPRGGLQVVRSEVQPQYRGQKAGIRMYLEALDQAAKRGGALESDTSVSESAQRMYDAMERRGNTVERGKANPDPYTKGTIVSTSAIKPVFSAKKPSPKGKK